MRHCLLTASLQDVLEHWAATGLLQPLLPSDCDEEPVCIYLRKEVAGAALATTTLRSLDATLVGGRAVIRYQQVYSAYIALIIVVTNKTNSLPSAAFVNVDN